VTATGTLPLSYQWYFDGTNQLTGATNSVLTVTDVQLANVGQYSVVAANPEGSAVSRNALLMIKVPSKFALAVGGERIMELTTNGDVVSWGGNQFGELGDYTLLASTNPIHSVGLNNVATMASGLNHSLAVDSFGVLWAWGDNQYGQLGDGNLTPTNDPVPVLGTTNPVIAVAAGGEISVALTADGTVWQWGSIQMYLGG
jgi:alpha-tubulin suppressor-like RCC1 family protein